MDSNLEDIIKKVAIRNAVSPIKLKLAVDILFKNVKQIVQRDDMPTVFLHGLGRLGPSKSKIHKTILAYKRRKDYLQGEIDKLTDLPLKERTKAENQIQEFEYKILELDKKILKLQLVYKRLLEEKHTRNF
jgi:hypothetical protein